MRTSDYVNKDRDFLLAPMSSREAIEWAFYNLCDDRTKSRWSLLIHQRRWDEEDRIREEAISARVTERDDGRSTQ